MAANDFEAQFVQEGKAIDYTPSGSAVSAGEVIMVGELFGVAARDIADGELGALQTEGVFKIKKNTSTAFTLGAKAFWDVADNELNSDSVNNPLAGTVVEAALAADTHCFVKINRGYVDTTA